MSNEMPNDNVPLNLKELDALFNQLLNDAHYSRGPSRLATDHEAGKIVHSSGMLNEQEQYDSRLGDFSSRASALVDEQRQAAADVYDDDNLEPHIDEIFPYQSYDQNKAQLELDAYEANAQITQARIEVESALKQKILALKKQAEESSQETKLVPDGQKVAIAIKQDSSAEEKELARIALAKMIYKPNEIYAEPYFFEAVDKTERVKFDDPQVQAVYEQGIDSLYTLSRKCPKIDSIGPACLSYLQEHFPLGNELDQEQFSLIILALFDKMKDGDICIDLRSLNGVFDTIVQWHDIHDESKKFNESARITESLEYLIRSAKYYCPKSVKTIEEVLKKSLAVGSASEVNSPLVFDNGRLYLRRSFNYETGIANFIAAKQSLGISEENKAKLIKAMGILFPKDTSESESNEVNMQEVAAALSSQSNFTVISGGPGTGKTTTVLRILLLLICMDEKNRNIKLCAPTGKAAARMSESIAGQLNNAATQKAVESMANAFGLSVDTIMGYIPSTAVTVHSLIKTIPHSAYARYNQDNRLKCDVLVVDEVSMLDMAMFSKLLSALEDGCKIIMLGDKDQLASVEAGAVLAELCSCLESRDPKRVDEQVMNVITEATHYAKDDILNEKISGYVALLSKSWRSKDVPEIGELATLVNNANRADMAQDKNLEVGDVYAYYDAHQARMDALAKDKMTPAERKRYEFIESKFKKAEATAQEKGVNPAIAYKRYKSNEDGKPSEYIRKVAKVCLERGRSDNYAAFLEELERNDFVVSSDPEQRTKLFKLMDRFRILCSNHNGDFGDKNINTAIESEVKRTYLKGKGCYYDPGEFFPGQIVIITQNNPALNLVNGYVGFVAFDEQDLLKQLSSSSTATAAASAATAAAASSSTAAAGGGASAGAGADFSKIPYKERKLKVFLPIASEDKLGQEGSAFTVISTMLLTQYDSGYAMSIHKSQGSEYDKVSIILAKNPNRVLTKELVYTGITRAKKNVELISSKSSLCYALFHSVERESGLSDRLAAQ